MRATAGELTLVRSVQGERIPQDLVDGVAGFGVESAEPVHESRGGDRAHLLDLKRSGAVEAVVGIGLDDHVERELAQGRRSGDDDREPQARVMETVVGNDQARAYECLLGIRWM